MFYLQKMEMGLRAVSIGDFGNYGADSLAGGYLRNNEETQGYEELQHQTNVAAFKVFAKDKILRDREGKIPHPREGGIVENVKILIEANKECKLRLTKVAHAGEGKLQRRQNEDVRERTRGKWCEFLKQIWGGMYFKITERIQELWTYINQDGELQLRTSCDILRMDMGDKLGLLKVEQQNTLQGMGNVVSAVDTRLIQNGHRNTQQEEALRQLCTSLTDLNRELEKNIGDTKQINNNYIAMEKRMEEKDKNSKVELGKVSTQWPNNAKQDLGKVLGIRQ